MWDADWSKNALCQSVRPDELFVRGAAQNRAKRICAGCPVKSECLAEALDNQIEWGVWGGMNERERRALLNRRPHVPSWRQLLTTATEDHAVAGSASAAARALSA
jgi:WhiB family redox-sensing transcriptional regulator